MFSGSFGSSNPVSVSSGELCPDICRSSYFDWSVSVVNGKHHQVRCDFNQTHGLLIFRHHRNDGGGLERGHEECVSVVLVTEPGKRLA